MAWSEEDEANKVHKFLNCGLLEPEDLKPEELRALKHHRHQTYLFVKYFLEERERSIENGEWSQNHEPPDRERRIKRYERGHGVVDRFDGRSDSQSD